MENQEVQNEEGYRAMEKIHRRGKVMGGLLVVSIGALFLARELGAEIPAWVFSWKMLLIGLGIVAAIKHKFLHPAWIILIGIGGTFLIGDLYPDMNIKPIMWPVLLILLGLFIIFKPRKKYSERMRKHFGQWKGDKYQRWQNCQSKFNESTFKDDYVESTVVMASVKKNVFSKKFKGGEVTNIFGSTELNLMQADMEERAKLDVTSVFGGVKLIVPANWEIRSELVTIIGSVEDKRAVQPVVGQEPTKLLVLTGDTIFGGIEISSY
jgi:predicted membrane protein